MVRDVFTPLAHFLLGLQLTISSKTSVVAHSAATATHIARAHKASSIPAKVERGWLDCGVYFTGAGKPNKLDQNSRMAKAK